MNDISGSLPPPQFYKVGTFAIPDNDPWKNDLFNRKKEAEKLWGILEPTTQPLVMTLSAPFGFGKTTFIKCWHKDLEKNGTKCVYFNAWETDHSGDAFVAFVSSIKPQLKDNETTDALVSAAKKISSSLLSHAPSFIASAFLKLAVGERTAERLKEFDLQEDSLADFVGDVTGDVFKQHDETASAIETFRRNLEKIIENDFGGRLIIFVDDLDRCRPNYAVAVLERIKHIFSVKGVIFVLGIDKKQIQTAISGVYGNNTDAERYLRKFIDWNYRLNKPDSIRHVEYLCDHVFKLREQDIFRNVHADEYRSDTFVNVIGHLSSALGLSLRDVEQFFTYFYLLIIKSPRSYNIDLAVVAFLKCYRPSDYETLINWGPIGQFNKSPMQGIIEKVVRYENDREQYSDHIVSLLLIKMSSILDRNAEGIKVSIEAGKIAKLYQHEHSNDEWLLEYLKPDIRHRIRPSLREGLKAIQKIEL